MLVQCRHAKLQQVHDGAEHPVGVGRAAGDIDHSFAAHHFTDRHAAGRIGRSRRQPAKSGAAADRDDRFGICRQIFHPLGEWNRLVALFAERGVFSLRRQRNRPLDNQHIFAAIFLLYVSQYMHRLLASRRHQRLMKVQADHAGQYVSDFRRHRV